MNITIRLKELFAESGKTQAEMAKFLDVRPATVNEWLSGKRSPRQSHFAGLSKFFGVPASKLFAEPSKQASEVVEEPISNYAAQAAPAVDVGMMREVAEAMYLRRLREGEPAGLLRSKAEVIDNMLPRSLGAVYVAGYEAAIVAFRLEQSKKPAGFSPRVITGGKPHTPMPGFEARPETPRVKAEVEPLKKGKTK